MKKIILGSILTIINLSAWSACTYDFDATNKDLISTDGFVNGLGTFPIVSGSKFSYKTQLGTYGHVALSKKTLKRSNNNPTPNVLSDGDKNLPNTGIHALELEMKVPEFINSEAAISTIYLTSFMVFMENGKQINLLPVYSQLGNKTLTFHLEAFKYENPNEDHTVTKFDQKENADGYRNIGIYLNQDTQQIGVISNGVNHGYIYSYPSKLKNISISMGSMYNNINSSDVNKDFSIELITDVKKFKNKYPTGTTDICGTKI